MTRGLQRQCALIGILFFGAPSVRPQDRATFEAASVKPSSAEGKVIKLVPMKAPVEMFVIDHVEKPSEN